MDGDKAVVPQFWLGRDVEYRTDRKSNALSAAEYNSQMTLPTLAELRHAFFGGSEDYKQSALAKRGYGEWTSTFLQDGKKAVERPENVVYRNGVWVVEGGKVTPVELPPDGWTLEYDKPTGFPSRTSQKRKDAEKVFGDDTSYFYATRNGTRAVLRDFFLNDSGPFYVDASYGPDAGDSGVGGRACRRSEQDAQRLATPIEGADTVTMSLKEYMTLMENYRQLTEAHDRFGQEYHALSEAHQKVGDLLARIKVQK
jgi:hypothetical protein